MYSKLHKELSKKVTVELNNKFFIYDWLLKSITRLLPGITYDKLLSSISKHSSENKYGIINKIKENIEEDNTLEISEQRRQEISDILAQEEKDIISGADL